MQDLAVASAEDFPESDIDRPSHTILTMSVTEVGIRSGLREGMLIHCAYIRKSASPSNLMLPGEQNCSLGIQGVPLVTLWPLLAHVQRTVSPTAILTVAGIKVKPCPIETSKIVCCT